MNLEKRIKQSTSWYGAVALASATCSIGHMHVAANWQNKWGTLLKEETINRLSVCVVVLAAAISSSKIATTGMEKNNLLAVAMQWHPQGRAHFQLERKDKLSTKEGTICFLYMRSGGSSGITAAKWPGKRKVTNLALFAVRGIIRRSQQIAKLCEGNQEKREWQSTGCLLWWISNSKVARMGKSAAAFSLQQKTFLSLQQKTFLLASKFIVFCHFPWLHKGRFSVGFHIPSHRTCDTYVWT